MRSTTLPSAFSVLAEAFFTLVVFVPTFFIGTFFVFVSVVGMDLF
jgi:hypothetical protein